MSITDANGNVHQGRGTPDGGKFAGHVRTAPSGGLIEPAVDLTTLEPSNIDAQMVEIDWRRMGKLAEAGALLERAKHYEREIERRKNFTHQDALIADYEAKIVEAREVARELSLDADEIAGELVPLEREFERRGGWTRAWLVPGGHVHKSLSCSTCFPTTRYHWLTELSGADEAEIVDRAGDRACTVCHPTAPTSSLSKPSTLFTPDEIDAAAARDERAAAKVARDAAAATKALMPDGSELAMPGSSYRRVKTLVMAEREVVDVMVDYEFAAAAFPDRFGNQSQVEASLVWRDLLVTAIAAKRDIAEADVLAELRAKAEKKFKREWL